MKYETMIVDDDPVFVYMMKILIAKNGLHTSPKSFSGGTDAYDFLKNNYSKYKSFIIFLDLNMPGMNGWEFLEAIKSFANPHKTIVVIVTSSTDQTDVRASTTNEFVVEYLPKPIYNETISTVKEKIEAHIDTD